MQGGGGDAVLLATGLSGLCRGGVRRHARVGQKRAQRDRPAQHRRVRRTVGADAGGPEQAVAAAPVGQGGRHGAIQRPALALLQAMGRISRGQRQAQRPAALRSADAGRTGGVVGASLSRKHGGDVMQQRRGGVGAEMAGVGRAVWPADPDANGVARRHAQRPGVAKAEAGAGLPGQPSRPFGIRSLRVSAGLQDVADDEGGAGAHQPAFDPGLVGRQPRQAGQTVARQRPVGADQLGQSGAGAAQDQAEVGRLAFGHAQAQPAAAQLGRKAGRADPVEQINGRHIQRLLQRL